MDLLLNDANYGSSDEDSENENTAGNKPQQQQPPKLNASSDSVLVLHLPPSPTTNEPPRLTTATSSSNAGNTTTTKIKRLLSLASVLPPHILAALTKQQQQQRRRRRQNQNQNDKTEYDSDEYHDEYDDDDDDDDSDDDNNVIPQEDEYGDKTNMNRSGRNRAIAKSNQQQKHSQRTAATNGTANSNSTDNDTKSSISSFLNELRQVGFSNTVSTTGISIQKTDGVLKPPPSATKNRSSDAMPSNERVDGSDDDAVSCNHHTVPSSPNPYRNTATASKLGDAFLQSTTTTITTSIRKSNTDGAPTPSPLVRNIHDDNTPADTQRSHCSNQDGTSSSISRMYKLQRPRITIQAAPPVQTMQHQSQQQATQFQTLNNTLPPPTMAISYPDIQPSIEQQQQSEHRTFLSRKEIERTLRRNSNNTNNDASKGNNKIEEVWKNSGFTQTQEGADPNLYAPNAIAAAQQHQQEQLAAVSSGASFIKHSTTHIYDSALGMTVPYSHSRASTSDDVTASVGVTSTSSMKGKGKNQINSLLAQAVTLERERNEQSSTVITTTKTTQQIHRANAKRKYGW